VVERRDRPVVTLCWSDGTFAEGRSLVLGEGAAHHAQVRRVREGDPVRLLDGAGAIAHGEITRMDGKAVAVSVSRVEQVPRPVPLEMVVPVADRDRMLVAAEKCTELQVTSWRPVYFARSRSVSPRGAGPKFHDKVRARMQSALEQSGGAWLPAVLEEAEASDVLAQPPHGLKRFLLDVNGEPLAALASSSPTMVAVGPEGGLEPSELAVAAQNGWTVCSLGSTTLRFETAVISAAAVIRAIQHQHRSS
jgi:16S rRNA (uracil1498-N3)-methyltransferase